MKIKVWSDLHLEFREFLFDHIHLEHPDDKETTLLLAGDISLGTTAKPFVEEMCKHFKHVLMIHGNHEYYHQDFSITIRDWKNWELNMAPKNFHFLYNDWRVLDDVRFLGGTMWTSFNDGDPITMGAAHRMMNDYNNIRDNGEIITPDFILKEHEKFMEFLLKKFDEPFDGLTVVMSHHSPGSELKRKGHRGDRLGGCYFADIEQLIGYHDKAVLWVHGHTHMNWDYMINNTRVVCNPYGYWGHGTNRGFDRMLILEI
jgi:Calcineurin-like phosphoesterase